MLLNAIGYSSIETDPVLKTRKTLKIIMFATVFFFNSLFELVLESIDS